MTDILAVMAAERDRLTKKRQELEAQVADLQRAIASIDHELSAIAAYETARSGKPSAKVPRGTKREIVLAIIKDNAGITRGGIIDRLKAQGQDRPETGLSNMLNALKTAGKITADDGKYTIVV